MAAPRRGLIDLAALALAAGLLAGVPGALAAPGSELVGMTPVRVADTRDGTGGVPVGKVGAGQTLTVPVTLRYSLPAEVAAVSLNVTVTQPATGGHVRVYPCGQDLPLASNLNFTAGRTVPNAVIAKTGAGGAVCLYASTATHLVVDLNGYFPTTADYTGITPVRAADTRDGTGVPEGKVPAGQTLAVPIAGVHGVPANATSAAVNVTVTQPTTGGHVRVYPCGQDLPFASNLNFTAGLTVPNAVIAGVGDGGAVCLYTTAETHLLVDVGGYLTDAAAYVPVVPERVFDTRTDWEQEKLPADEAVRVQFAEPGELVAVVLNVTVTQPDASGYITVYPCSETRPWASNLNFVAGQTVPNMVIAPVNANGEVCFYTRTTTHLLADINGVFYVPDTTAPGMVWGLEEVANLDGTVALSWNNPVDDDFAGVRVIRAEGEEPPPLGEGQELVLSNPTDTAITDEGLALGQRYTYALYAYDTSGNISEPRTISVVTKAAFQAQSLGNGSEHACAIDTDSRAWCWGSNTWAQLGVGLSPLELLGSREPLPVASANLWSQVDGGLFHSCAVTSGGTVECWGGNLYGELGIGETGPTQPNPVEAIGLSGIVQVAIGGTASCARDGEGQAWCWGPGRDWDPVPQPVGGGHSFVDITSNGIDPPHACGLDEEGRAWCWGNNSSGQLGNGADPVELRLVPLSEPTEVAGDHRFVQISTGSSHTCAVDVEGATWCWGSSRGGVLGDGEDYGSTQLTPQQVEGASPAVDVFAAGYHTCALATGGQLWCWGERAPNDGINLPTPVAEGHTFIAADTGDDSCGIEAGGAVWCGLRRDQPSQVAYIPAP